VVTYLRLWRNWTVGNKSHPRKTSFISMEASIDVIMACHFAVNFVKLFRHVVPNHPGSVPLGRTGTDPCEDQFSALGSFIMNKRVYTFEEALQTIRSQMKLRRIMARGNIVPGARRRHNHVSFDSPVDAEIPAPSPPNTVEAVLLEGWKAGIVLAYRHATEDGMKPSGGRLPTWWKHPHKSDPDPTAKNQPASRGEEDLLVEDDSEDDDDDDECTDEDEDDDEDDGNEEDDLEEAVAGVVLAGDAAVRADITISQTVRVEGGNRVHKRTIVKNANVGITKTSADRERRVQQARDGGLAAGLSPVFNVSEDEWKVGLGSDVAVLFEVGRKQKCFVGKILTMTMKRPGAGSRKVRWRDPVVIREDRADLKGLQFMLHYYTFTSVGPAGTVFETTEKDGETVWIDVTSIVFPVTMTFDPDTGRYTMPTAEYDLFLKAEAGTLVEI
jgi:hypothetical protein